MPRLMNAVIAALSLSIAMAAPALSQETDPGRYIFRYKHGYFVSTELDSASLHIGDLYVGHPVSKQGFASGGTGAYSWSSVGSALPAGLTVSSSGLLSGTPLLAGSFPGVSLRVVDQAGAWSGIGPFTVDVYDPVTADDVFAYGVRGQGLSAPVAVSGGKSPYSYSVINGSLPSGVSLASGTISGAPSETGSFGATVRVSDVNAIPAVSGEFEVNLEIAEPLVTAHHLPSGVVGASYLGQFSVSGGTAPFNWYQDEGVMPNGLTLHPDGRVTGTPTEAGSFPITARVADSATQFGSRAATISVSPALGIANSPPDAYQTEPYSFSYAAVGGQGPYTFTRTDGAYMPAGLTLNPDGTVTGTVTTTGSYSMEITVTDSTAPTPVSAKRNVLFGAYRLPQVSTTSAQLEFTQGRSRVQELSVLYGKVPITWSIPEGELPEGMNLGTTSISGAPYVSGDYTFTLRATDANGKYDDRVINMHVYDIPIVTTVLPTTWVRGEPISFQLEAMGGKLPFGQWTRITGTLPHGVSLNGSGLISGTPTAPPADPNAPLGTYNFRVSSSDANNEPASRNYTITLVDP